MFKKKPKPADLAARRDDLQARLSVAEDRLQSLRADAVTVASSNPDALPALSEPCLSRTEFEIAALTEALRQAEQAIEMAEEAARQEADKAQREATSRGLHLMADALELAAAPVPDALQGLREAFEAASHVLGASGLPQLLQNLSVEIPEVITGFVGEIRARADQTLAGTAPPTVPAPFVPTIIRGGGSFARNYRFCSRRPNNLANRCGRETTIFGTVPNWWIT